MAENPNGYKFKLQFHIRQSFKVEQELNYLLYKEFRKEGTSLERKIELEGLMKKHNTSIKLPQDVSLIKSYDKLSKKE